MTYEMFGKMTGYSKASIGRLINAGKGAVSSDAANRLAAGGCMTAHEWKHSTPKQRKRKWKAFCDAMDDARLKS